MSAKDQKRTLDGAPPTRSGGFRRSLIPNQTVPVWLSYSTEFHFVNHRAQLCDFPSVLGARVLKIVSAYINRIKVGVAPQARFHPRQSL
jgi:hypothetical protein